jgi:hypothetical protein
MLKIKEKGAFGTVVGGKAENSPGYDKEVWAAAFAHSAERKAFYQKRNEEN